MYDGDGGETLELQAGTVAQNIMSYNGSRPCPTCGVIMSPIQYMYSKGVCPACHEKRMASRIQKKLA